MSVNLAILGSGLFAQLAYLPSLPSNKQINLHTLWSRSQKSVTALDSKAKEMGYSPRTLHGDEGFQQILDDPEIHAVSFILPITAQPELILKALKAGKHVLSEKPVGKDTDAAKALIEEYEKVYKPKGLLWRVAENYEFDTILQKARRVLKDDEKTLGPILYWQFHAENYIEDGSMYQATSWRTIPDYQGGFLLDGGVHWASMIRRILPDHARPATIISSGSLHRAHLPPHDTVTAIALAPKSSLTDPHGSETSLETINKAEDIPGGVGKSSPNGTILITFALPDTPKSSRLPLGLTVTCLHGVVKVGMIEGKWVLEVVPGAGTSVKASTESAKADGVARELGGFADAVLAAKDGKSLQGDDAELGDPRGPLWDVALIQALLRSEGKPIELSQLV